MKMKCALSTVSLLICLASPAAAVAPLEGDYVVSYSRTCPAKVAATSRRNGVAEEGLGRLTFDGLNVRYRGLTTILDKPAADQNTERRHRFRGTWAISSQSPDGFHTLKMAETFYRALLSHLNGGGIADRFILYTMQGPCVEKWIAVREG